VNTSKLSQKTEIGIDIERPEAVEPMPGATGPITKAISRRRSHRRQWRTFEYIAMIILDAWLVTIAFELALQFRIYLIRDKGFLAKYLSHTVTIIRDNLILEGANHGHVVQLDPKAFIPLEIGIVIGMILIFAVRGLYKIRLTGTWFQQVWTIISSATVGLAFLITYYFVFQPQSTQPQINSRLIVPFVWATTIVVLCLGRLVVSFMMGLLYRIGLGETRLLVVGSGRLGKMTMQHIAANPNLGYSIIGFLHDMSEEPNDFGRFKMLGTLDDIGLVIKSMQIDEVIIALPSYLHDYAISTVKTCEHLGASFKLIPDLYEMNLSRIDVEALEGIPLIGIKQVSLNTVQRAVTRIVDITVASLILILGLPVWLCISAAILINSRGPIIYAQKRVGLNGKEFDFYKFRSMYQDADKVLAALKAKNEAQGPLFKMRDDPRRTPVGRFLRRTSLDEFPQLISVITGEMSLVGPRPPLPREVAQYEEWQKGRLAIKPGLTGLWQVRGRSDLSFDEGVLMDLYYIENWSLRLYFQILLRTIPAVLLRRGAY
jgi:exopolysaccharide biosynthesis polyprenyl glycosylphosphotransferase